MQPGRSRIAAVCLLLLLAGCASGVSGIDEQRFVGTPVVRDGFEYLGITSQTEDSIEFTLRVTNRSSARRELAFDALCPLVLRLYSPSETLLWDGVERRVCAGALGVIPLDPGEEHRFATVVSESSRDGLGREVPAGRLRVRVRVGAIPDFILDAGFVTVRK